ncbi:MAG: sigma-E processing peptidase SpoIIGA [Clostridia bacterium]|nr:sigma-E processing peptidase SpoIIGA [Clostridia bacterium]
MIVYADVLFLINFCMDYLILKSVSGIMHQGRWLAVGAAAGGMYGVLAVRFPALGEHWCQMLAAAGIVWFSFRPKSLFSFCKGLCLFWTAAFLLGGMLHGILFRMGRGMVINGMLYFDFSLLEFSVLTAGCWLLLWILSRLNTFRNQSAFRQVEICSRGRTVVLPALVDTGCSLRDPLTGFPVMVAEYDQICCILSDELKGMLTESRAGPVPERIYQVPFSTVEQREGELMTAFRPDSVTVIQGKKQKTLTKVLVGVVQTSLARDQSYTALLHPAME